MAQVRTLATAGILVAVLAALSFALFGQSPAQAQVEGEYVYSAKFVCGRQGLSDFRFAAVRPGIYATEINIHNYNSADVEIRKFVVPLVNGDDVFGREPGYGKIAGEDYIVLPPRTATMDDCARLYRLLNLPSGTHIIGFLELRSRHELAVDAVYTSQGPNQYDTVIEVERVEGRLVTQ